jgi:hypothetical protein
VGQGEAVAAAVSAVSPVRRYGGDAALAGARASKQNNGAKQEHKINKNAAKGG